MVDNRGKRKNSHQDDPTDTKKRKQTGQPEEEDDEEEIVGAEIEDEKITRVEGEEEEEPELSEGEAEMEPFNLRQEREEGYFDRSGHYVENRFEKGVQDAWLEEYDEKWAKKFKAQRKNTSEQGTTNAKEGGDDEQPASKGPADTVKLKKKLVSYLNEKENTLAALRRYSAKGPARDMDKFNTLTECADELLSLGFGDIYSDSKERIAAEIKEDELELQNEGKPRGVPVVWEYKLKDGTTFGPYSSQDMAQWQGQGYFSGENVLVRQVKQDEDIFTENEAQDSDFVLSDSIDFRQFS